jgi:hypothetical protein
MFAQRSFRGDNALLAGIVLQRLEAVKSNGGCLHGLLSRSND